MATTDRYDRQLRLWGSHGQRALMQTHILLVNADAAGTETLKNCVLPGVGRFTIVDGAKVSEDDAGNNFFVHLADKGRPRAEVCAAYLTEMNADVKGASVVADPETYDFEANLAGYSIVVASNLSDALLGRLAALCWVRRVPLVAVSSNGFLCTYRLQVRDHGIVESKIDQSQRGLELSLATPFPALRAFCAQFDLPSLDFAAHSHVPYVAVLLQTADEWRTAHGSLPSSFKEKQAFRELVRSQARDLDEEANFQEASEKAYQAYAVEPLSDELAAVLACAREQPLSAASGDFAFLLAALDRFVTAFGQPPLSGALPDMTCTTELFVALQTVYRRKADEDRAAFAAILKGLSDAHKHKGVSAEAVELFCRSARTVRLVSTSSMADSLKGARSAAVLEAARDPYADAAQVRPSYNLIAVSPLTSPCVDADPLVPRSARHGDRAQRPEALPGQRPRGWYLV